MLFMFVATDGENTQEARQTAREAHVARLMELEKQKRLVLAGPNPLPEDSTQFSGSLIVADFNSLDDAQAWAESDPYVEAGVYNEILIRPFSKVFPA